MVQSKKDLKDLSRQMQTRGFAVSPKSWRDEGVFVRPTPHPELWYWANVHLWADHSAAASSVILSITYCSSNSAYWVSQHWSHPLENDRGRTDFDHATARRDYFQWFAETVDKRANDLFIESADSLLERTAELRQCIQSYFEKIPQAESLWHLESQLRSDASTTEQRNAERLASAAGQRFPADTYVIAALCFLRHEVEIEGRQVFERDFDVPLDKPIWHLDESRDCYINHPAVLRLGLLADRIYLKGKNEGYPECVDR